MSTRRQLLLVSSTLLLASACATPTEDPSPDTTSSELSDERPVGLRYATLYDPAHSAVVVEVTDRSFKEHVSVAYQTPQGSWAERDAKYLRSVDRYHEVWFVDGLPAAGPLRFAVHYKAIFSGGTTADYWDNNAGANYSSADGQAAMGGGVDVAVTDASVAANLLSAKLLVRNRAFQKNVEVVFSTDNWTTNHVAAAPFDHGGGGGDAGGEVWRLSVPFDGAATSIRFAAVVRQNGTEAWDNNFGKNFACTLHATSGWSCTGAALLSCGPSGCTASPEAS